jgi:YegS/Rv2252/BmrU family lipid kinase
MARVPVLLNCNAGAVRADKKIGAKVSNALAKAGIDGELELIEGGKCAVRCRAIVERGDPLVIVGGGDGTISAAASALAGTETTLGILPLGTLNHFARDLGLPTNIEEAVELVGGGSERRVDVGDMNNRPFINNSSIGLYARMVIDRDLQRAKLGRNKRLAMIVASVRALIRFKHRRLTLTINDEAQARIDTPLLFVGNNIYRTDLGAPGRRESIEEGELSVYVMRKKTRTGLIGASLRALFNRSRSDDLVEIEGVQRLRVGSHRHQLAVSLDGEVVRAAPPLDYRIRPRALRVIAP